MIYEKIIFQLECVKIRLNISLLLFRILICFKEIQWSQSSKISFQNGRHLKPEVDVENTKKQV